MLKVIKSKKQNKVIAKFIAQQVNKTHSVSRGVSGMLKRYPEEVNRIVPIALELYPNKYKQIIKSAIQAESALACDVVKAAISSKVVSVERSSIFSNRARTCLC